MKQFEKELREKAAELLKNGEAAMVIGYSASSQPNRTMPVFIQKPEECDKLVLNRYCENNLSIYLSRLKDKGKLAIVAKPCDVRTIVSLIHEKQVERDQLHIISFSCPGMMEPEEDILYAGCGTCEITEPPIFDTLLGGDRKLEKEGDFKSTYKEFVDTSREARWEDVRKEMENCIRCYACRNACPMCYCEECFVERSVPRWIGEGSDVSDTTVFHIMRALHSAGRCGDCGACVRACPMGVDLSLIAKKVSSDVYELFEHRTEIDPEKPAALADWDKEG